MSHKDQEELFERVQPYAQTVARAQSAKLISLLQLPSEERWDIEQELLLLFWTRLCCFDSKRGSLKTFAARVINNCAVSYFRRARARKAGYATTRLSVDLTIIDLNKRTHRDWTAVSEQLAMRVDVRRGIASLPTELALVAICLSSEPPAQAAQKLHVSRPAFYRRMAAIRTSFRTRGLNRYLPQVGLM